MGSVVNWSKIIRLALSLFAAQALFGLVEGFLSTSASGVAVILAGHAASLAVCSAIFAANAIGTPNRPLAHAWLGLLLQVLIAVLFSVAISPWLGSMPWLPVISEWVVLVVALAVGTSIGIGLRHRERSPADA
jgi:hypothetical protein